MLKTAFDCAVEFGVCVSVDIGADAVSGTKDDKIMAQCMSSVLLANRRLVCLIGVSLAHVITAVALFYGGGGGSGNDALHVFHNVVKGVVTYAP